MMAIKRDLSVRWVISMVLVLMLGVGGEVVLVLELFAAVSCFDPSSEGVDGLWASMVRCRTRDT